MDPTGRPLLRHGNAAKKSRHEMEIHQGVSLLSFLEEQRSIFEKALPFLKPRGRIVYMTCSLLAEENREQIAYFSEKHGFELEKPPISWAPQKGGMDGFFGAVLQKKQPQKSPDFEQKT